ncbi:MAG: HAD family hydrolase [Chthoniobacterales bacterium]|nr:HAD family hydrolase [Chthoniobacterales bacterium]MBA3763601.1 HAD family hydrolase [Chthoniobacterales bacterium]
MHLIGREQLPLARLSPAVFLDRDGTIMRDAEYCGNPKDVEVFAGAAEALRRLKGVGFKIIIITNQSGIGRGFFTEADYRLVEGEVERQLGADLIAATYFCPDIPDSGSTRRKPETGMILEAERDHQLDLARSFFVGDKAIDAECGRRAGLRTIIVTTGIKAPGKTSVADWVADNLAAATDIILAHAV